MARQAAAERVETLERGDIFFFYRPRVERRHPGRLADVERFYLILRSGKEGLLRRLVVGQKYLPDPGKPGRRRFWGFVDAAGREPGAVLDDLRAEEYRTKTRGERFLPAARPAGEGVYRLLRHGDHTHLVYALELPEREGDVQQDLHIEQDASYVISIRNPEQPSKKGAGLSRDRTAHYPRRLQEKFGGRDFIPADPAEFLDVEGAEFLLVSASEDVSAELGVVLKTEDEDRSSSDIIRELRLDRSRRHVRPLFEGDWE